jgi:hypothetical protein
VVVGKAKGKRKKRDENSSILSPSLLLHPSKHVNNSNFITPSSAQPPSLSANALISIITDFTSPQPTMDVEQSGVSDKEPSPEKVSSDS